jgi:hypothetical protein
MGNKTHNLQLLASITYFINKSTFYHVDKLLTVIVFLAVGLSSYLKKQLNTNNHKVWSNGQRQRG